MSDDDKSNVINLPTPNYTDEGDCTYYLCENCGNRKFVVLYDDSGDSYVVCDKCDDIAFIQTPTEDD